MRDQTGKNPLNEKKPTLTPGETPEAGESPLVRLNTKENCEKWRKRLIAWMETLYTLLDEGRHELTHWKKAEKAASAMRKVRTLKVFEPQLKALKVHLFEGGFLFIQRIFTV